MLLCWVISQSGSAQAILSKQNLDSRNSLQYSGALLDLTKGLSSSLGPALAPQAEAPATAPSPATTAAGMAQILLYFT